jgi:hypothetical protein
MSILFYVATTIINFLSINGSGDQLEINDSGDTLEL